MILLTTNAIYDAWKHPDRLNNCFGQASSMSAPGRLPTDTMLHPLTAFRSVTVPQARELASPAECPLTVDRPQSRSASGKSRPRLLMVVSRHRVYSKEILRELEASTTGK